MGDSAPELSCGPLTSGAHTSTSPPRKQPGTHPLVHLAATAHKINGRPEQLDYLGHVEFLRHAKLHVLHGGGSPGVPLELAPVCSLVPGVDDSGTKGLGDLRAENRLTRREHR